MALIFFCPSEKYNSCLSSTSLSLFPPLAARASVEVIGGAPSGRVGDADQDAAQVFNKYKKIVRQ